MSRITHPVKSQSYQVYVTKYKYHFPTIYCFNMYLIVKQLDQEPIQLMNL